MMLTIAITIILTTIVCCLIFRWAINSRRFERLFQAHMIDLWEGTLSFARMVKDKQIEELARLNIDAYTKLLNGK